MRAVRELPGEVHLAALSRKERTHETRIQVVTPVARSGDIRSGSRSKSSSSRRRTDTVLPQSILRLLRN